MLRRILVAVSFFVLFTSTNFSQVNFTSSNLPIVVIDTHGQSIKDEPKITGDMGIIDNGSGQRNNLTDQFNGYKGKIGIEIRGHSSMMFPKKQYGIELRDETGNAINASLLGMPEESDWVLNASYTDKTFLRNVLAFKLYNDIGRYSSRTRFCEVVLNNEYIGLYILQEKIKRDKNRVNIKKMNITDNSGDAVTGGYIIKIDRVDPGDKSWRSPFLSWPGYSRGVVDYVHVYPNAADITTAQQKYIRDYVTQFETVMNSSSYKDPFTGYYNYIDVDAFADYFILNEFSKNTDAYRLSAYMYKNRNSEGGKLTFGPIWDYDISFGLANYDDGYRPQAWQALKHYDGIWSAPFWTTKLLEDPFFANKLAKSWVNAKNHGFHIYSLTRTIEENTALISEAIVRNFAKWKILGVYVWPEQYFPPTYEEEISYLKSWINDRTNWLNNNLPAFCDVEWLTPDLSKVIFEIGKEKKIPVSYFVKSTINISSVDFLTNNLDIELKNSGDSLSVKVLKTGSYVMKGVGKRAFDIVSISPEYKINAGTSSIEKPDGEISTLLELYQNYPNPFNPSTTIKYSIPVETGYIPSLQLVTLKVFDLLGREVTVLVNEEKCPGNYEVKFNVETLHAKSLPSGIYFYTLVTNNSFQTKKMILMR